MPRSSIPSTLCIPTLIRVLNEEFDKRTALHDAELYTQMTQLKMESSFQDFAASLDLLAHMIEERCGTRVSEAQLLSIIFNGLPQHADPLVSLLKQGSEMSYTKVKVRLLQDFHRLTFTAQRSSLRCTRSAWCQERQLQLIPLTRPRMFRSRSTPTGSSACSTPTSIIRVTTRAISEDKEASRASATTVTRRATRFPTARTRTRAARCSSNPNNAWRATRPLRSCPSSQAVLGFQPRWRRRGVRPA